MPIFASISNGWRLKVSTASRYIDARIDNEKPMRLRAVSTRMAQR